MPDLDAFEAEVKAKIKQLSAKDPAARRKAAAWLGEAGDPTAITALAQAYKNDADPRVKEAARYSLGMFRKLEQELEGDNSEAAMALLQKVALEGKMGGRQRIPTRSIVKVELALLLSAVLVAALAFVLPGIIKGGVGGTETVIGDNSAPTQAASAAERDRATIMRDLRSAFTMLSNNATKLQAQYQLVLGGGKIPCNEFFDSLTPYTLSPANAQEFSDLATIATDINQAETDFASAKGAYDRVCSGETLSAGDFGGPMGATVAIIQRLPAIDTAITTAANASVDVTAAPVEATATTQPTAAGGGVDLRPHLIALQNIIDDVTSPTGAYTLLNQYWTEAASAVGTQGCSYPFDVTKIPADYALPPEITPAAPTLKVSADLVNTGLRAIRDGWQTFGLACSSNTLLQYTVDSLARMDAAKQAFDTAARQIAGLRSST
ncbi:MAG: HEAT repeat domain-containing protein [Anaerolineae bacterium]|nr:HEAT repeat domain-containing protein [Anaerolineae bacterium]